MRSHRLTLSMERHVTRIMSGPLSSMQVTEPIQAISLTREQTIPAFSGAIIKAQTQEQIMTSLVLCGKEQTLVPAEPTYCFNRLK